MDLELVEAKTALLCMDVHEFTTAHIPAARMERLVAALRAVLGAARTAGVPIIYVAAARRASFTSPRNKFTARTRAPSSAAEAEERTRILEAVAPAGDEPIVRKPRINAFFASELQSMLSARDIDTVVLTGVSTNFVVESTARHAVDADYRVIVLEDCCAAASEEDHARAIASMTPMLHIATSGDFVASVGRSR